MELPKAFLARMQSILPESECSALVEALNAPASVAIRQNRYKPNSLPESWQKLPVPWCAGAFHLNERPIFTLDPVFHAGGYYVQEAASMAVGQFLKSFQEPLLILDLCAAPGGKTTLLADAAPAGSVVVANETIRSRVGILTETLTRWGNSHVVVSNNDSRDFAPLAGVFDVVLVDAPCSGEGLWRRRPQGIADFSAEQINHCAARQMRILTGALPLVKNGGLLIYSTCTWAEEENEQRILELTKEMNAGFHAVSCPELVQAGWIESDAGGFPAYRAYPHRVAGEGLFVCALQVESNFEREEAQTKFSKRKVDKLPATPSELAALAAFGNLKEMQSHWRLQPQPVADFLNHHGHHLKIQHAGIALGQQKGKDFAPDHAWAMAAHLPSPWPETDVDLETAWVYLKKEPIALGTSVHGVHKVCYQGLGLGWLKNLGSRSNNLLPKSLRIRRDLDAFAEE